MASFRKRYIGYFRHQKRNIVAAIQQICCYAGGDDAVVLIFEKFAVWAAFAERLNAVAVVDEDFHGVAGLAQLSDSVCKVKDCF